MNLLFANSRVKEENFWRNYFYRVSLIKQSLQLTAIGKQLEKVKAAEEANALANSSTPPQNPASEGPQVCSFSFFFFFLFFSRRMILIFFFSLLLQQQQQSSSSTATPANEVDSDFISDTHPEHSETWLKDMKAELDQLGVSVDGLFTFDSGPKEDVIIIIFSQYSQKVTTRPRTSTIGRRSWPRSLETTSPRSRILTGSLRSRTFLTRISSHLSSPFISGCFYFFPLIFFSLIFF